MLSIGEFARATGLSSKALRLYDDLGLLNPAEVDPGNGYRYYAPEQVEPARLVARLRSAGVPLPRIAAIIGAATPEAAAEEVLSYWSQVEADRASARDVVASLVTLLTGENDAMTAPTTVDVSLADLIARVYDDLPDADDLARLGEARRRARALSRLGDQLVDHYVGEAKLGGASWDAISEALGSSDQLSPSRRTPHAFERFSETSRRCIVLAQEAARAHHHEQIGAGHVLLGLLDEPRGLAYDVLTARSDETDIRAAVEKALPPGEATTLQGHIPFGADSKDVIERALRTSHDLGHSWVGTEHLVLGLMRADTNLAGQVLRDLGFTADELHERVTTEISRRLAAG